MAVDQLEYYENLPPADEEIQNFMEEEIHDAPKAPNELIGRLREHNSTSPADSGGDIGGSQPITSA